MGGFYKFGISYVIRNIIDDYPGLVKGGLPHSEAGIDQGLVILNPGNRSGMAGF